MKVNKPSEKLGRRPFYDGAIDIKRWRMQQKLKRLKALLRSWLQRNHKK